jgi:hypothetical protein
MAEEPNQMTPELTKAMCDALDQAALDSTGVPTFPFADWQFRQGHLPGQLYVTTNTGEMKVLHLTLGDMPIFTVLDNPLFGLF